MDFTSISQLANIGYLVIAGILAWYAADMRSILRRLQRKNQLTIEGRWGELEKHLKQGLSTRRPFVWFHQRYLLPGSSAAQYGLFLYEQGRLEKALVEVDKAVKQIESKPVLFRSVFQRQTFRTRNAALSVRAMILTAMGRYEEAREAATRLGQASGSNVRSNPALASLELNCGRLDEAIALAKTIPSEDPQYDTMRVLMAWAYALKGEFGQAIESLSYKPSSSASKHYSAIELKNLSQNPEGAKFRESQDRIFAGVFPPARWLRLAHVHLAREELKGADDALNEAGKALGSNPVLQVSYWRARARCYAGQSNFKEADESIAKVRAMTQQLQRRSTVMESHLAIGISYLSLRRFSDALAELTQALTSALHPIEKHKTNYWIARTHESAGNLSEAKLWYQKTASDPIQSWMRRKAEEALNK